MDRIKSGMIRESEPQPIRSRLHAGCIRILGRSVPIFEGINIVGRSKKATVNIKNLTVSQMHALIVVIDGTSYISDPGSSNCTVLNGTTLRSNLLYCLDSGAELEFGSVKAIFMKGNEINLNETAEPSQSFTQTAYEANTQIMPDKRSLTKMPTPTLTQVLSENQEEFQEACNASFEFAIPGNNVSQTSQLQNTVSRENGEKNEAGNSDVTSIIAGRSSPNHDIFNQQTQRLNTSATVTINSEINSDMEDRTEAPNIHEMETQVIVRDGIEPGVSVTETSFHEAETQVLADRVNETVPDLNDQPGLVRHEAETQVLAERVNETVPDLNDQPELVRHEAETQVLAERVNETVTDLNDQPGLVSGENEASEPFNHPYIGSEIDTPMLYRKSLSTENIIDDSMNDILPATQDDDNLPSPVFRMNEDELTDEGHIVSPVFNQTAVIDNSEDEAETNHKQPKEVESQLHTSQLKRIVRYRLNSDEDENLRNSAESQVRMKRNHKMRDPFAEDSDEEPAALEKPEPRANIQGDDDGSETDIEDIEEQNESLKTNSYSQTGKDEEQFNNDSNIIPATQDVNMDKNRERRSLESNGETSQGSFKLGLTQLDDELNVSSNSKQNRFNEAITQCVSSTRNEEDLVGKSHDETCLHKNCRDSDTFQEDVYMMNTQKLINTEPVNKSIDDGICEQATQKLHNRSHDVSHDSDDEDVEATQKIDGNLPAQDVFIKPTITPKKHVHFLKLTQEEDIYIKPTQKMNDDFNNKQRQEEDNMDESCYLAATQKLDTRTIDDSRNHSSKQSREDEDLEVGYDLAATQKLDVGTREGENVLESQSQLEVAFPTQTLKLVDSDDKRPSNPLLSLFEKQTDCEKSPPTVPKIKENKTANRKSIYVLSSDDDDDDNSVNVKSSETETKKSCTAGNAKKQKCQLDQKEAKQPEQREAKVVLNRVNEELTLNEEPNIRKSARSRRATPKIIDQASTSNKINDSKRSKIKEQPESEDKEAKNKRVTSDVTDENVTEKKPSKRKLLEDVNKIEVAKATPTRSDQIVSKRIKSKKQIVDAALEENVPIVVLPKVTRNQGRVLVESSKNDEEAGSAKKGVQHTSRPTRETRMNDEPFTETTSKRRAHKGSDQESASTSSKTGSSNKCVSNSENLRNKRNIITVDPETTAKTRGVGRKNSAKSEASTSSSTSNSDKLKGGKSSAIAEEPETPTRLRGVRRKNSSKSECSTSSETTNETPAKNRKLSVISETSSLGLLSPERSRRKLKPKVVFTMMDSPELESVIRQLGGLVVDDIHSATVLVTESVKRSLKLLCAIGQAKPICKPQWLKDSKKSQQFLDPSDYILRDQEAETKWNFSLVESLERSKRKKLLEGYIFFILVTNALDVLKSSIEACGGKYVSKVPAAVPDNFYVIASNENKAKCNKFRRQDITVIEPEAIFDGVLRQELRFDKHILK